MPPTIAKKRSAVPPLTRDRMKEMRRARDASRMSIPAVAYRPHEVAKEYLASREETIARDLHWSVRRLWRIADALHSHCMPTQGDLQFLAIALDQVVAGADPLVAFEIEGVQRNKPDDQFEFTALGAVAEWILLRALLHSSRNAAIDDISAILNRQFGESPRSRTSTLEGTYGGWRTIALRSVRECSRGTIPREYLGVPETVRDIFRSAAKAAGRIPWTLIEGNLNGAPEAQVAAARLNSHLRGLRGPAGQHTDSTVEICLDYVNAYRAAVGRALESVRHWVDSVRR